MLDFKKPELKDREWAQPLLARSGRMGSENAFGTLFIWQDVYHTQICHYQDFVLCRSSGDQPYYLFPCGTGDIKAAITAMMEDAEERKIPFVMLCVSETEKQNIESLFPNLFRFTPSRDSFDYIYSSESLITLSGRKLHGKRNHLSRFTRTYPDFLYEDITEENIPACREVAREWCRENGCGKENGSDDETCALNRSFQNFDALHLFGGLIRIDGKPVAFTVAEEINPDACDVHFEKALDGYEGLYPAINHEFAARNLAGYRYINREEDLGIEGLRKAKLSYYPEILLEKYRVEKKG